MQPSSLRADAQGATGRTSPDDIRSMLSGPGDAARVRAALSAMSPDQLMAFGLGAYRINLLSLFGGSWSPERIEEAACDAARSKMWGGWHYHHDYLPSLTAQPDGRQVTGIPMDAIADVLSHGRGVLFATFHVGHMRFLASDIAQAGISITMPLADDAFRDYSFAQASNPDAAVWRFMRYVNVEEKGGSLAIARVMARGGGVLSAIDGNTGIDGPHGDDRRAFVRIHQRQAKVKDGLFRMAARFGTPILPLVAVTIDGRMHCISSEVIDPKRSLSNDDADRFVEHALQSAYGMFADAVAAHPGDWCGGDLFHQWRLPEEVEALDADEARDMLAEALADGGRVVLDRSRVVAIADADGALWTDARTMRCYRFPEDLAPLAACLEADGVDARWLEALPEITGQRAHALLRQLFARRALRRSREVH